MGAKVERTVDFINSDRTQVRANSYAGEVMYMPQWDDVAPGVRCRTWSFKDIDESVCDGALIEIQPGRRTPVQHVVSDTTFCEVPFQEDWFSFFRIRKLISQSIILTAEIIHHTCLRKKGFYDMLVCEKGSKWARGSVGV